MCFTNAVELNSHRVQGMGLNHLILDHQRSLELPTILVTNQHSLSDAEDFTEGYRTLKLGKVVGQPTADL